MVAVGGTQPAGAATAGTCSTSCCNAASASRMAHLFCRQRRTHEDGAELGHECLGKRVVRQQGVLEGGQQHLAGGGRGEVRDASPPPRYHSGTLSAAGSHLSPPPRSITHALQVTTHCPRTLGSLTCARSGLLSSRECAKSPPAAPLTPFHPHLCALWAAEQS